MMMTMILVMMEGERCLRLNEKDVLISYIIDLNEFTCFNREIRNAKAKGTITYCFAHTIVSNRHCCYY